MYSKETGMFKMIMSLWGRRSLEELTKQRKRDYFRKWEIGKDYRNKPAIGSDRFFSTSCAKIRLKAEKSKLDFNLNSQYLKDIFPVDGKCPALKFTLEKGINGIGTDRSPSLDRINNKLGYTKDNVQWVSRLANQIMSSATPDQVIQVGTYFKKIAEGVDNEEKI